MAQQRDSQGRFVGGGGTDVSQFLAGLEQAQDRAIAAARVALQKFANHVIGDSQQYCPVDTGALQASGTVADLKESGGKLSVEIGHNTNYAAAVHERMNVHHPIGEAKYLESAVRENAPKFADFVINEVKKAL